MKILVIGHARHGKDTVCELLREVYGLSYMSSSEFCAEKIIFPLLAPLYGYKTVDECFEDRANHRSEWFNAIREYNSGDLARLGCDIFSKWDVYCGLRNVEEMSALKNRGVYDISIWVDAQKRLPPEASSSNTITSDLADYTIDNNGSVEDLHYQIEAISTLLFSS